MPITTPSTSDIVTDTTPAISEARVPQTTRDNTSRPSSSVPNQYAALGALRIAPQLVASGSLRRDPRREDGQHHEEQHGRQTEHRDAVARQLAPGTAPGTGLRPDRDAVAGEEMSSVAIGQCRSRGLNRK